MPWAHLASGIDMHYYRDGSGESVLFIHALTMSMMQWRPQMELRDRCDVLLADLRGHGRSNRSDDDFTVADYAGDMRMLLNDQQIDSAHVVASSFGCSVAIELALQAPERVRSLVLVDPVVLGHRFSEDWVSWWRPFTQSAGNNEVLKEQWLAGGLFSGVMENPDLAGQVRDLVAPESMDLVRSADNKPHGDWIKHIDRMDTIAQPTMVINGSDDHPDFQKMAEEAADRIPSSIHEVIEGIGHFPNLEAPERTNGLLRRHLLGDEGAVTPRV